VREGRSEGSRPFFVRQKTLDFARCPVKPLRRKRRKNTGFSGVFRLLREKNRPALSRRRGRGSGEFLPGRNGSGTGNKPKSGPRERAPSTPPLGKPTVPRKLVLQLAQLESGGPGGRSPARRVGPLPRLIKP